MSDHAWSLFYRAVAVADLVMIAVIQWRDRVIRFRLRYPVALPTWRDGDPLWLESWARPVSALAAPGPTWTNLVRLDDGSSVGLRDV